MHERKNKMYDLSDAVIALPGGMGTLDEFFEILTWAQLGLHTKPCGVLNIAGYFDHLLSFLDHATTSQLLRPIHRQMVHSGPTASALITTLQQAKPVLAGKWCQVPNP